MSWTQKVLRVNLTNGTCEAEEAAAELADMGAELRDAEDEG